MAAYDSPDVKSRREFQTLGGLIQTRDGTYEITTAPAAGDVFRMVSLAPGERVWDLQLISDDLDSNAAQTLVLDVGDGADVDRYIAGSTIGQTGGMDRMDEASTEAAAKAMNYSYTAGDTIDVTVKTVAATFATGKIHIRAMIVGA